MSENADEPVLVNTTVEMFQTWLCNYDHQPFYSLQEAYQRWLFDEGFALFEDHYPSAVAVLLVYLSRALVSPKDRYYLSNPDGEADQWTVLQVTAPSEEDELTHWEFLTEANFRQMYADWKSSREAPC